MTGSESSHHVQYLNQSDAKLQGITTWSTAFTRDLGSLEGFILSFHCFLKVISSLLITAAVVINLVLRRSIKKRSKDAIQND